jgi:hypothetical protein
VGGKKGMKLRNAPFFVVNWGPLYTRSQGQKIFGPTLSIFGLSFGLKLLIKARTLAPRVANWAPKFDGILFPALGPIQAHKAQDLLVTWDRFKRLFSSSALTPRVKPLGLISAYPPIGMLDSGWTLAQTHSVKWAWVSSCFEPLFPFTWAPPLLLHIFSLLLPIQLV